MRQSALPDVAAWARDELRIRKREQLALATYADFCAMKRRWGYRRKAVGLTRAQAKRCLAEAERESAGERSGERVSQAGAAAGEATSGVVA